MEEEEEEEEELIEITDNKNSNRTQKFYRNTRKLL
jgi:hypothetical protein